MDLILYSVPIFFLLIIMEIVAEKWLGTKFYRVADSLTSLATGTINQLVNVSSRLIPFTVYALFYEHIALFELGNGPLVWLAAFILFDFFYYWNHRLGHEMNILWAAHVVHHSSEEYNLTTALRQTGTGILSFIFYLPMALMGFDPLIALTVGALNLIYQFWVHTQHIGKLGWYEWFFVTPSNHRGHHAQNTVYIDRNYGGVFIIWDRLFGSYQEELEHDPPVFGIRGAVKSWNPLWVNMQIYNQLFWDAVHTKNVWHKLTIWFRRTGWRPPDVEEKFPLAKNELASFVKYQTHVHSALKVHGVLQYITTAIIGVVYSLSAPLLSLSQGLSLIVFILLSCFSVGALLESRHYAGVLEWLRLAVLFSISLLSPIPLWLVLTLCLSCVVTAPFLFWGRFQQNRMRPQPKQVT